MTDTNTLQALISSQKLLSRTDIYILSLLLAGPLEAKQSSLASQLGVNRDAVTQSVKKLRGKGLIKTRKVRGARYLRMELKGGGASD